VPLSATGFMLDTSTTIRCPQVNNTGPICATRCQHLNESLVPRREASPSTCVYLVQVSDGSVRQLATTSEHKVHGERGDSRLTRAALVMLRSFITSSKAAVSSACFWLCKAIFSLNLRGLFEDAIFASSSQWSVTHDAVGGCRRHHARLYR